jgi:hypothetical protein
MPKCDSAICTILHWYVEQLLVPVTLIILTLLEGRWKSAVNMVNPLGSHGNLAHAFAQVLHELWKAELPYISPIKFRVRNNLFRIT